MDTKVTIVRHGRTDWNFQGRVQGSIDRPLDEVGIGQAEEIACMLKCLKADYVFSSDLTRAMQTAEIIAKQLEVPLSIHKELREVCYGEIEGMLWSHFSSEFHARIQEYSALSWDLRKLFAYTKTSETYDTALSRVLGFLQRVCIQNPSKHMIVVTHGGIIKGLLAELLGADDRSVRSQNTGYFTLHYLDSTFEVQGMEGIEIN